MKKFISVDKMSKKARKEYYSQKRKNWGGLSPVTRCPDNPKAYNRAKSKRDNGNVRYPSDYFIACI